MTLFSLAKRNIRRNGKVYLFYLYPMVFSIVIYFTFVSLQYNKQITDSMTLVGKIEPAFQAASFLLLVFSAAFIWFSNSFFTRRRKKEVALYSLFGIEKKQIGMMLFYENIILGIVALCIGLLLGILLSKLFAMILIKLMAGTTIAMLTFSAKAIIQTIVVFMLIIIATSLHNYRIIYRHSLLQLLKADKLGENKPKHSSLIPAILSLLLIGGGYTILLQPSDAAFWKNDGFQAIMGAFFFMLIGTYLFVRAFILFVLEKMKRIKSYYFKGVNLISITHLFYRIKGNVLILSVVALLSTCTLFAIGTTFSLYYNMNEIIKKDNPYSIIYTVPDAKIDTKVQNLMTENGKNEIKFAERVEYLSLSADLSEISRVPADLPVILISESSYQRLAEKRGIPLDIQLKGNDALTFYDGNLDQNSDPYTGRKVHLSKDQSVTIAAYENYSLFNQGLSALPMVIKDEQFEQLKRVAALHKLQLYNLENERSAHTLDRELREVLHFDPFMDYELRGENILSSFYYNYHELFQVYGLLIFISAFLGFVFLLATGSMLHYKLLMEATTDQPRYQMLKKIGMCQSQIRKSIGKQLLLIYLIPLIIAVSHSSIFILALSSFLRISMTNPFIMTICVYIGMYSIYYFLTLTKYTKIVSG